MAPGFRRKETLISYIAFAVCLLGWSWTGIGVPDASEESLAPLNRSFLLTQAMAAVHSGWMPGTVAALSDFDGDNKVDVAVGRRIGNELAIEIQLTSRPGVTILKSERLLRGFRLVLFDINKDNDQDIIATDPFESHLLAVWLGDGKGGFTAVDQARFADDYGLTTSPSCQRSTSPFRQDLLNDSPRLLCDRPVAAFDDQALELTGFKGREVIPALPRQDHSFLTPRSPPRDYPV